MRVAQCATTEVLPSSEIPSAFFVALNLLPPTRRTTRRVASNTKQNLPNTRQSRPLSRKGCKQKEGHSPAVLLRLPEVGQQFPLHEEKIDRYWTGCPSLWFQPRTLANNPRPFCTSGSSRVLHHVAVLRCASLYASKLHCLTLRNDVEAPHKLY